MTVHSAYDGVRSDAPETALDERELEALWHRVVGRRSFLKNGGLAGAGTVALAALTPAAAEILESDLWEQYAELGGQGGGNGAYVLALQNLDGDMPQYISDNTDDELSHAAFLNAYLLSKGSDPVHLDPFSH